MLKMKFSTSPAFICLLNPWVVSDSLRPHGLPGFSVHGILQARILEWIAISYSSGSSWPRDWTHVSRISCTGRQILYHWCHLRSPSAFIMKVPQSSPTLWSRGLYSPWNSPGQNTGVGSHSFLQGIFLTWGSNPGLPRCRQILHHLSYQGSPFCLSSLCLSFKTQPRL